MAVVRYLGFLKTGIHSLASATEAVMLLEERFAAVLGTTWATKSSSGCTENIPIWESVDHGASSLFACLRLGYILIN